MDLEFRVAEQLATKLPNDVTETQGHRRSSQARPYLAAEALSARITLSVMSCLGLT